MVNNIEIHQFICRSDNYGLLMHDKETGLTASFDTPDGETIWRALAQKNWQLTHIFNTHHHYDHVPGNDILKERTGCTIIGSKADAHRIPGIDVKLRDQEVFSFGNHRVTLLETPGHTLGSVCYFVEPAKILFTGDTLFSMGCGRLFEGSAKIMWDSLQKILALPDETKIYCGHEYTLTNAEFATEIDPDNKALAARLTEVKRLRRAHQPTLPVSLAIEKATNPFLRPDNIELQKFFNLEGKPLVEVFGAIRQWRNNF